MEKIFEIYIRTTPERLWEAITDPRDPQQVPLRHRGQVGLDARVPPRDRPPGAPGLLGEGEVLEVDPPRRLVQHDDRAVERRGQGRRHHPGHLGDRAGRATPAASTVTHDQLREGANDQLYGGWPMILSGLKTWLETGELLTTPGSLMYAG